MIKHSCELPEEILQNIQSLMESEEAAQSSLLSKSWYKAYSTRPILYFDSSNFSRNTFLNFVTTTVQRYLDLKIKVNKLVLAMEHYHASPCVVDKLIVHVLKLRMNVLHLYFWNGQYCPPYVLSASVFANECLDDLHLSGCEIHDLVPGNVRCCNLKSLSLSAVSIEDNEFKNILTRCHVVEHLTLSLYVEGLTRINASELVNLKSLIVQYCAFGEFDIITSSVICGRFLNLIRLELRYVSVDDSFFTNISSSFPKLEDLTIEILDNNPTFQISSRSIRILSLMQIGILKVAELDVPNIRNFKFAGDHIPPLSFTAASQEWKSEICLSICNGSDLLKLREFLTKLSQSKITLRLSIRSESRNVAPEINIENFHLPAVMEELTFSSVKYCEQYNFFVKCILCCRPKLVSLHVCIDYEHESWKTICNIQFMYKKLIEQRNQNSSELEEVNVELLEESLNQWQPVKTWSDDLENSRADTLRFKLKWGSLAPEYTIIKLIQYQFEDSEELESESEMMYPSNI